MNDQMIELLLRAGQLLEQCAEAVRRRVNANDLEAFPYIPEMEEIADQLRAEARGNNFGHDGIPRWGSHEFIGGLEIDPVRPDFCQVCELRRDQHDRIYGGGKPK
jgi:hypothetical protein